METLTRHRTWHSIHVSVLWWTVICSIIPVKADWHILHSCSSLCCSNSLPPLPVWQLWQVSWRVWLLNRRRLSVTSGSSWFWAVHVYYYRFRWLWASSSFYKVLRWDLMVSWKFRRWKDKPSWFHKVLRQRLFLSSNWVRTVAVTLDVTLHIRWKILLTWQILQNVGLSWLYQCLWWLHSAFTSNVRRWLTLSIA